MNFKEDNAMNNVERIKQRLNDKALRMVGNNPAFSGTEHKTAFVFADVSMNFHPESFSNIEKDPQWLSRIENAQMQSSNSSDALLMNIFCFPDFSTWEGPRKLLKIQDTSTIEFGWNPELRNGLKGKPTEVDMKIGDHIFEAKLTETDFTGKEAVVVEKYEDFETVFDKTILRRKPDGEYENYQLIRNILAAYKYNYTFTLLVDETRTDLIKHLFETIVAVNDPGLRQRITFVTWQELVAVCGEELKTYICEKYLRQ
jgi:hypothetical protein